MVQHKNPWPDPTGSGQFFSDRIQPERNVETRHTNRSSKRPRFPGKPGFILFLGLFLLFPQFCLDASQTVVVISPHNAAIRYEFGRAFAGWYQQRYGQKVTVEWRTVGGSSDSLKFVLSEFASRPEGIGVDVFFGGGPEPYLRFSEAGLLQPYRLPDSILRGIPPTVHGVRLYDPQYRWYGAALACFGIVQNRKVLRWIGLPAVHRWTDLADPRLYGWVAAGDPRRSGTMSNMYEAYLQALGWETGWRVLASLAGNADRFDRMSSTTARRVTEGEAAYGLAIDFYGLTQVAAVGRTNVEFVLPTDFIAMSIDGIGILRGAPHRRVAQRFLEFVLGPWGQKLWILPKGYPDGPKLYNIPRMPVRPALYRQYRDVGHLSYSPFEIHSSFHYNPELGQLRRGVVSDLFGALFVDLHPECKKAWQLVRKAPANSPLWQLWGQVPISESQALAWAKKKWRDPTFRNRKRMEWQRWALRHYQQILQTAASLSLSTSSKHMP